jgi:serine/threonine-protein kinase HipA
VADHVEVFVQIAGEDIFAGRLWPHRRRGSESQTFSYSSDYLGTDGAYELDPLLKLYEGAQQTPLGQPMFGAFADCAPDRWGRRLIVRGERHRVAEGGGTPRSFGEIDYLLGVRDDLRQGALRFREPDKGVFVAEEESGIPALINLPRLLSAAERVELEKETEEDLALLLHQGSSLGGTRPKAHILDQAGRIAIAKFPSPKSDDWNVILWEGVALKLARDAGIRVPDWEVIDVAGRNVLVVRRFDRAGANRIGYVSALTMLERTNGDMGSYLEIAEVIMRLSPNATSDLHELWRRIAFSILISNFDDHLRNHGFVRTSTAGWELSPAFDLNPDPQHTRELHTAITFDDFDANLDVLMSVAPEFRLPEDEARTILSEVSSATRRWASVARDAGATDQDIESMAPAFEHEAAHQAKDLVSV